MTPAEKDVIFRSIPQKDVVVVSKSGNDYTLVVQNDETSVITIEVIIKDIKHIMTV